MRWGPGSSRAGEHGLTALRGSSGCTCGEPTEAPGRSREPSEVVTTMVRARDDGVGPVSVQERARCKGVWRERGLQAAPGPCLKTRILGQSMNQPPSDTMSCPHLSVSQTPQNTFNGPEIRLPKWEEFADGKEKGRGEQRRMGREEEETPLPLPQMHRPSPHTSSRNPHNDGIGETHSPGGVCYTVVVITLQYVTGSNQHIIHLTFHNVVGQ